MTHKVDTLDQTGMSTTFAAVKSSDVWQVADNFEQCQRWVQESSEGVYAERILNLYRFIATEALAHERFSSCTLLQVIFSGK